MNNCDCTPLRTLGQKRKGCKLMPRDTPIPLSPPRQLFFEFHTTSRTHLVPERRIVVPRPCKNPVSTDSENTARAGTKQAGVRAAWVLRLRNKRKKGGEFKQP
jgi:hypothetical protein